jgi:hypothetical protein
MISEIIDVPLLQTNSFLGRMHNHLPSCRLQALDESFDFPRFHITISVVAVDTAAPTTRCRRSRRGHVTGNH